MKEPKHMTVQELKDELAKYPDYMPVICADSEFITTTEEDTIEIEDSAGCHTYGIVRIC